MNEDKNTLLEPKMAYCQKHGPFIQALFDSEIQQYRFTNGCPACNLQNKFALLNLTTPLRFKNASFENFHTHCKEQERAKALAEKFFSIFLNTYQSGICAFMFGQPGTGKTHLAYAMVSESWKKRKSAAVVPIYEMIAKIRESWRNRDVSTEAVFNAFINLDLLIIDEIGVQAGSDNEREILFKIINRRYEEMKSTVLISNLSPKDTKEVIGQRSFERITGEGGISIPFQWASARF